MLGLTELFHSDQSEWEFQGSAVQGSGYIVPGTTRGDRVLGALTKNLQELQPYGTILSSNFGTPNNFGSLSKHVVPHCPYT